MKPIRRSLAAAVLTALASVALAACGSDSERDGAAVHDADHGDARARRPTSPS